MFCTELDGNEGRHFNSLLYIGALLFLNRRSFPLSLISTDMQISEPLHPPRHRNLTWNVQPEKSNIITGFELISFKTKGFFYSLCPWEKHFSPRPTKCNAFSSGSEFFWAIARLCSPTSLWNDTARIAIPISSSTTH